MELKLNEQAERLFREAMDTQAAAIAGAKLYTGSDALRTFGLTRSSLKHIPETYLPGRSKPLYSAAASNPLSYAKLSRVRIPPPPPSPLPSSPG